MSAIGTAERIGISEEAFRRFVRGDVPDTVAEKVFGSNAAALQRFVDGGTSLAVAARLNCSESALQELRDALGRQGAVGLLIGLSVPPRAIRR
jgi:hypothetical protein